MKVAFFSTHKFERDFFESENAYFKQNITYFDVPLGPLTAELAKNHDCVCCFVNDNLNKEVLNKLKELEVKLIALRSVGFNHVNLNYAQLLGLKIVRVPAYSPHAVAEHALALLLSLNRKIPKAYSRVRDMNFSLEGLMGFDLYGKTIGVIGTGKIGSVFAKIMKGLECRVLAYDPHQSKYLEEQNILEYVNLDTLYNESDIISLHLPLTEKTHHLINSDSFNKMKNGTILINTSRGALVNSKDLITALKSGKLNGACLDVYEEEEGIFFEDLSNQILKDDVLARLLTFPNVLITSHQAFCTREALTQIAHTTLKNISDYEQCLPLENEINHEFLTT